MDSLEAGTKGMLPFLFSVEVLVMLAMHVQRRRRLGCMKICIKKIAVSFVVFFIIFLVVVSFLFLLNHFHCFSLYHFFVSSVISACKRVMGTNGTHWWRLILP